MEPMPCPKCGSLLRIPDNVPMIRCPNCQTILALESDDEEVPLEPAPSQPAPLPFGQGAKRAQAKPVPASVPRSIVRAKLADDRPTPTGRNPYEKGEELDPVERERRHREQMRQELAELDEAERKAERRYERIRNETRHARTALNFFSGAAIAAAASGLFYFLYTFLALFDIPIVELLWLSGVGLIFHFLLTTTGFGFGCAGPKQARVMAIFGLIIVIAQEIIFGLASLTLLSMIDPDAIGFNSGTNRGFITNSLLLGNLCCNLSTVIDLPVYLLTGMLDRPWLLLFPIIGGCLEFAKLSLLGLIVNRYAILGKAMELSHNAMRFVYRIFGLVLVGTVVKIVIYAGTRLLGALPMQSEIFAIPIVLCTNGFYLWWCFSWFAQFQVIRDIVEVVTADRYTDLRYRLDD